MLICWIRWNVDSALGQHKRKDLWLWRRAIKRLKITVLLRAIFPSAVDNRHHIIVCMTSELSKCYDKHFTSCFFVTLKFLPDFFLRYFFCFQVSFTTKSGKLRVIHKTTTKQLQNLKLKHKAQKFLFRWINYEKFLRWDLN